MTVNTRLVDGGFLIWTYGPDAFKRQGWAKAKWNYTKAFNNVIILDGGSAHRIKYYPDYKSDRRNRYKDDPERQEKKRWVMEFANQIVAPDPNLDVVRYLGHEADDIIAAWCVRAEVPLEVIGTDKDLVQLGHRNIKLFRHDETEVTVERFASKLQKTIAPFVDSAEKILLVISLLGDKSDSVPRLIPSGIKELRTFARILQSNAPWKEAVDFYGKEDVMRNLYLTILPGPFVFKEIPTPEQVLDMIVNDPDKYYESPLSDELETGFQHYVKVGRSAEQAIKELGYDW